jgi:hypothetical protein
MKRYVPLFVGALAALAALIFAHGRSTPYNNYALLADAMLHGRLWIDPLWHDSHIDAVLFNGHRYIVNDPIPALFMLPLVAIFGIDANQTLLACLFCGAALSGAWLILERLELALEPKFWLAIVFLIGTDLLWTAMLGDVWFIAQTAAVAFLTLMLAELLGKARPWLVIVLFALAVGCRFTIVMALPVVLYWTYAGLLRPLANRAALRTAVATLVPFCALWVAYNLARWGVPWDSGHTIFFHQDQDVGSPTGSPFAFENLPDQLYSFFVQAPKFQDTAPYAIPAMEGVALTWTSPILIFAAWARGSRSEIASLWVATVLVAGPSFLYYVNGASQFGMRHALDFEPFLFVLLAIAARRSWPLWAAVLAFWSSSVGLWGIWYWNTWYRATY